MRCLVERDWAKQALKLEGRIARRLRQGLRVCQHEIRVQGRLVGEIDVELETAIIEVASGKGRKKFRQIQRLLHNHDLNPSGKPVVVFGPQCEEGSCVSWRRVGQRRACSQRARSLGRSAMRNIVVVTPKDVTQAMVQALVKSLGGYWNADEITILTQLLGQVP